MNQNRPSRQYWDNLWEGSQVPTLVDPRKPGLRNFVKRKFHSLFQDAFASIATHDKVLLEIGCARSIWLPYFAKEFGFQITGIDYSQVGCEQARQVLLRAEVNGRIECIDLFTPPETMLASFDVVVSFGVLEHFPDSVSCLSALAAFLRPGGIIITEIPNMTGARGVLQRITDESVYLMHYPMDANQMRIAHEQAKLQVLRCEYFISMLFSIRSIEGFNNLFVLSRVILGTFIHLLTLFSLMLWLFEICGLRIPNTKFLSPYVVCVAKKNI